MHAKIDDELFVGCNVSFRHGYLEVLSKHLECLRRSHDLCFWVCHGKRQKGPAVIGFHMVDHDVIQLAAVKQMADIADEKITDYGICRIDDSCLFVVDEITVICHPGFQRNQIFKSGGIEVVAAHPVNMRGHLLFVMHFQAPLLLTET